jgi:uncharacterized protein
MIINVKVKLRSSEQGIEALGDGEYVVYLKSEPEQNKANIELINLLSKQFGIPHARIKIKIGMTSGKKVIEML